MDALVLLKWSVALGQRNVCKTSRRQSSINLMLNAFEQVYNKAKISSGNLSLNVDIHNT